MPNQIILSMNEIYPFGSYQQPQKQNREILIRKKINTGNNLQQSIENAKYLKKLKVPHTIQIISIFSDSNSLQIYYQYVPVKFQIWMKNMSDELSSNLLKQLYVMATYLSQNHIDTVLQWQNIGCNQEYHIKYFLNFEKTIIDHKLNSNQLKQKYYREISILLKDINSTNQRIESPQLFYSAKIISNRKPKAQKRVSLKNMSSTPTLNSYEDLKRKNKIDKESLTFEVTEIQTKSKLSAQKIRYKQNLNDKLKNLKEKIQSLKQIEFCSNKISSVKFSTLQVGNKRRNDVFSTKKSQILKNSVQNSRLQRGVSTGNLSRLEETQIQSTKQVYRNTIKGQRQNDEDFLPSFNFGDKKIKSEHYKTPKNSESPVEYLDLVKSGEQYMKDFLNVLENNSEEQDDQTLDYEQTKAKQTSDTESGDKWLKKTEQSQNQNKGQEQKWHKRFNNALLNSKKLINKLKIPPKLSEFEFQE